MPRPRSPTVRLEYTAGAFERACGEPINMPSTPPVVFSVAAAISFMVEQSGRRTQKNTV
jgi:hypothetical protein